MDFRQAEEQFHSLERRLQAKQISADEYRRRLRSLEVVDRQGARWQIQERTGKWFVLRGAQWQQADPYPQAKPAQSKTAQQPARPKTAHQQAALQTSAQSPVKRRSWLLAISGILAACLACALLAGGGWLAYQYLLPQITGQPAPDSLSLPGKLGEPPAPPEARVLPGETQSVPADGASHADSHGVALTVPSEALPEGGQAQLSASTVEGGWAAALEKHYTIDTPFYTAAALGKDDGAGRLTLTFPAASPESRVLAVIDNQHLILLDSAPEGGQISLQVRAGPSEPETAPPDDSVGETGLVRYAVVTPRQPAHQNSPNEMVSLKRQSAVDRSCTPVLDAAYQLVSYCRESPDGSVTVNVPASELSKSAQVDAMVDRIIEAMGKYSQLNFTAAKLSKNNLMIIRVFTGAGSPKYKSANGVLYIPIDTVDNIATAAPHELYHEMAHWIQDEEYITTIAYYSEPKTWWLETAAENMVMLLDESYIAKNLTTYGTISHNGHQIAFQAGPNQWPGDYYVHAQMVKLNMCDSAACPFSQAGFVEAINNGTYPLLDEAKQALLTANLDDYARYLLGKTPQKANTAIPISTPLVSGSGYGEYVNITSETNTDLAFVVNGYTPQMRKEMNGAREQLVIEAGLEKNAVYPLAINSAEAKYAAIPTKLTIQPGAPFWYTLDNGEPIFADGTKEVIIQPIHIKLGTGKVRLVALGRSGGEVLRAKIEPLDLSGTWVIFPEKLLTNNLTCTGEIDEGDNPAEGDAALSSLLIYLIGAMGEMQPEATGRGLDWALVPSRLPPDTEAGEFTYQATALQAPAAIRYQANLDLPRPESRQFPPGVGIGMATIFMPVLFIRKDRRRALLALAAAGLLLSTLSGCSGGLVFYGTVGADVTFDQVRYTGGQDTATVTFSTPPQGQALWEMTGQATYDVNLSTVGWAVVLDEQVEKITTCTGTVTYQVKGYVFKDATVVIDDGEE